MTPLQKAQQDVKDWVSANPGFEIVHMQFLGVVKSGSEDHLGTIGEHKAPDSLIPLLEKLFDVELDSFFCLSN